MVVGKSILVVVASLLLIASCIYGEEQEIKGPLELKAELIGEYPLYPGQRATITYRIYYKGDVKLTKEELPLLDAKGFQKIGSLELKETTISDYNLNVITQEIRALKPGTFIFPNSILEGTSGQTKVQAEVPSLKIEVSPFPEKGKPPSFNGALGDWLLEVQLLSIPQVKIGDRVQLKITFTGSGEIETVSLPNLLCQPGFSGFFQVNSVPVEEKVKGLSKSYLIEIWPLSTTVEHIPAIQFSSFNTKSHTYSTVYSQPIPLSVAQMKQENFSTEAQKTSKGIDWKQEWSRPPQSISSNYFLEDKVNEVSNAYQSYRIAEGSTTVAEKKENYNQALALYSQIPLNDIGFRKQAKHLFNIGNCYFRLGQYPLAIFYYERALKLTPRDKNIINNLTLAYNKLDIKPSQAKWLSVQQSLEGFWFFLILTILIGFFSIKYHKLRLWIILPSIMTVGFLLFAAYIQYFTPLYAIQIKPSFLFEEPSSIDENMSSITVFPGTKMEVMEVVEEGKWLKIITPEGNVGYVPDSTIRII